MANAAGLLTICLCFSSGDWKPSLMLVGGMFHLPQSGSSHTVAQFIQRVPQFLDWNLRVTVEKFHLTCRAYLLGVFEDEVCGTRTGQAFSTNELQIATDDKQRGEVEGSCTEFGWWIGWGLRFHSKLSLSEASRGSRPCVLGTDVFTLALTCLISERTKIRARTPAGRSSCGEGLLPFVVHRVFNHENERLYCHFVKCRRAARLIRDS